MHSDDEIAKNELRERELLRKASHLSDFGTLTSLGGSALYIVERTLEGDKMPKSVAAISLAVLTVGMGAVFTSFYVRNKAGKIAHENEGLLTREVQAARLQAPAKTWAQKQAADPGAVQQTPG